jgi:release factor glutamine methyltransferase
LADSSSIGAVLADANKKLHAISHSARLDAELLLARAIDMPRSYLFAHPDELLDAAAVDRFNRAIQRRQGGEPMAYIIGVKEFWSLPLMVSPATLVPRPETELLVEQALLRIPRKTPRQVLDLGTGSGAIALAIAKERPLCDVIATDISEEALAIAMLNAQYLELPNIRFLHGVCRSAHYAPSPASCQHYCDPCARVCRLVLRFRALPASSGRRVCWESPVLAWWAPALGNLPVWEFPVDRSRSGP